MATSVGEGGEQLGVRSGSFEAPRVTVEVRCGLREGEGEGSNWEGVDGGVLGW